MRLRLSMTNDLVIAFIRCFKTICTFKLHVLWYYMHFRNTCILSSLESRIASFQKTLLSGHFCFEIQKWFLSDFLSALKRPKHFNLGSVPRPDEIKRLWKAKREHAIAKKTIKPFNVSQLITRLAQAGHLREDPDRLIGSIFLARIQKCMYRAT